MKVGLIGHRGFIGKSFSDFADQKYDVIKYHHRLGDKERLRCFVSGVDFVVNAAGKNKGTDEEIIQTNMADSINLISACAYWDKKLIHLSSTHNNKGAFSFSKKAFDLALKEAEDNLGLRYSVIECPNIIGRHCRPFYNSFITTLCYLIANKKEYESRIQDPQSLILFTTAERLCERIHDALYALGPVGINKYGLTIQEVVGLLTGLRRPRGYYEEYILSLKKYFTNRSRYEVQ